MERTQLFDLMGGLKLYGMKAAFDEIMATAVKRQHEPQRIVGDLLNAVGWSRLTWAAKRTSARGAVYSRWSERDSCICSKVLETLTTVAETQICAKHADYR
jgi:hypothetical protein